MGLISSVSMLLFLECSTICAPYGSIYRVKKNSVHIIPSWLILILMIPESMFYPQRHFKIFLLEMLPETSTCVGEETACRRYHLHSTDIKSWQVPLYTEYLTSANKFFKHTNWIRKNRWVSKMFWVLRLGLVSCHKAWSRFGLNFWAHVHLSLTPTPNSAIIDPIQLNCFYNLQNHLILIIILLPFREDKLRNH